MILLSYDRFLWIFSLSGSLLKHRRGELGCTHLPNLQIQPENVYFYLFALNPFVNGKNVSILPISSHSATVYPEHGIDIASGLPLIS